MKRILLAILLVLSVFLLCACSAEKKTGVTGTGTGFVKGAELMALAASEDEARETAGIYGIEFVSYENGVAVFHTEKDPYEAVTEGRKNGWPDIEVNIVVSAG